MVFFTCNACGQSIKKNKVEKHYQVECRSCEILSCMDCGKEFAGDEYLSHTSCISEAEKYQGALYSESNKGQPKGERKQQEWLERIRKSVSSVATNPRIANLLERIADYPNIPRKKPKFVNFVRNSLGVRDDRTLDQLWDAFNTATKPPSSEGESPNTGGNTGEYQKAEAKESVGGEQGPQAKVSEANDEKDMEKRPSKKQKRMGKVAEDIREREGREALSDECKPVDQGQPAATAPSGGSHGNVEMEAAGKATLKKKTDKSEKIQSEEVTEAASDVIEEPPKKKSKKAKATKTTADNCEQNMCTTQIGCTTESLVDSEDKAKDHHDIDEQDGCCGNIEAQATGEDGTTAKLRNVKKNSLKMESVEGTEAMSNGVEEPPKKRCKEATATEVSSAMAQLNSENKVTKSQSSKGGVVIEKDNGQTI